LHCPLLCHNEYALSLIYRYIKSECLFKIFSRTSHQRLKWPKEQDKTDRFIITVMIDSPFLPKSAPVLKKEEHLVDKAVRKGIQQIDEAFINAIPSDDVKQLPPAYLYPVGILIFLLLFGIFLAVFVPGEKALTAQK
jgi:hypothetical protein